MTKFFVRHPVATWMLFLAFVVLGVYSLPRLEIESMPEVSLPTLTVHTSWTGAAPQAIQRSITLPIEGACRSIQGVEKIESTSRAGVSMVEVSLRRETNIDFARLELNEELGSVRPELPAGSGQPQIFAFVPEEFATEDFFTVSLESALSPDELRREAEAWVVPKILGIDGVADVEVWGGADPLIRILLDRQKLDFYGITAGEVFSRVMALDELAGAGVVYEGGQEKLVAIREPIDLDRLSSAVVAQRGERSYTLDMLGEVRPDYEDPDRFTRADGRTVLQVRVEKRSGSNAVSTSRKLRSEIPVILEEAPFEASHYINADSGKDLEDKLVELIVRSGVILLFLFGLLILTLRQVRLTAIVTASILFAIVMSLSLFYFFGLSVNFITISGLAVCFGLILDNSILVLDAIHRRLEAIERATEAGLSRRAKLRIAFRIIVSGTNEVTFPIIATSVTTMVAFGSFIFLSGRLKVSYEPLAIAVATAMVASIFVAFAWIPVVLNQAWARALVRKSPDGPNDVDDPDELDHFVEDRAELDNRPGPLERFFGFLQRLWWIIVPATAALLIWSVHIYKHDVIKGGFWRLGDEEELFLSIELPAGTDVVQTSEVMFGFERLLLPIPEGVRVQARAQDNRAFVRIEFDEDALLTEVPVKYRYLFEEQADKTAGAGVFIRGFSEQPYFKGLVGGSRPNSLVRVTGYNSKKLHDITSASLAAIEKERRVRNARIISGRNFWRSPVDETVVTLRRDKLAELGMTVADAVQMMLRLLDVDRPNAMLIAGRQEQVQIAFDDSETLEFTDIANTVITTPNGQRVRAGELVELSTQPLPGTITRENQRYAVDLAWEYVGTNAMRKAYIKRVLDGLDLPYGFSAKDAFEDLFTQEEEEELGLTLVLAIVFIFIVLAALFESLTPPLMVLLSLPMALVGVFLLYWQTTTEFDSSAKIGLVLLFGIVVNNAILLVSRFRHESELVLREKIPGGRRMKMPRNVGASDLGILDKKERATLLRRAIGRATRVRLRSILLTSGTTIVGMAPLLLPLDKIDWLPIQSSTTEGSDIWDNLALTAIGGLASSTILLIFALPPFYYFCVRTWWVIQGWILSLLRGIASVALSVAFGVGAATLLTPDAAWLERVRNIEVVEKIWPWLGPVQLIERMDPLGGTLALIVGGLFAVSAVGLLIPRISSGAAAVLALVMLAGVASFVVELTTPGFAPIVALFLLVVLAYARKAPRPVSLPESTAGA